MAWTLILTNGAASSSASSSKSVTDIANFNRLVVVDKATPPPEGLTAAQLNQYWNDAVRDEVVRYLKHEAAKNLSRERAPQQQALIDQAVADTQL